MEVKYDNYFSTVAGDKNSSVFEIFPSLFGDSRGFFCEVFKSEDGWAELKQINRSMSVPYTVRGCHAQAFPFCQSKFVQALNAKIYDVIVDGRPDSTTFGKVKAYVLDPAKQNILFVPHGFLHAFCVPAGSDGALFEYFCDNVYDKASEIGVNPMSVIPQYVKTIADNPDLDGMMDMFKDETLLQLSEKDLAAKTFDIWSAEVTETYKTTGKLWYRAV